MNKKSIDQQLLEDLSLGLTNLWETPLDERRDANGVYRVPELNRTFTGFPTAAQATTQFTNLKQNQPYKKRLIPSPAGHMQIAVDGSYWRKHDGGVIIKGNTVDHSYRTSYGKPWSLELDANGTIVKKDLSRLHDEELQAVEYNLAVRNKHNFTIQPGQITNQIHEGKVLTELKANKHHALDKTTIEKIKQAVDNEMNSYKGADPVLKTIANQAARISPGGTQLGQILSVLARQNIAQEREIEDLENDNHDKENRFRQFNKDVASMGDISPVQKAKMAVQIPDIPADQPIDTDRLAASTSNRPAADTSGQVANRNPKDRQSIQMARSMADQNTGGSLDKTLLREFEKQITHAFEDWNKVNHHDKTNGLSQKAVNAYRREHPGSKLKTAVTTKPSKLKPGSKAAKRRKSFCARMSGNKGPMKKPNGKPTPKALALRRWHCESIEEMALMIQHAERVISEEKQRLDPKCWKGKHKEGTKIKGGVRVNNCVPNEGQINEKWSQKYKSSINCSNPKGFSQKAHCAGKKK